MIRNRTMRAVFFVVAAVACLVMLSACAPENEKEINLTSLASSLIDGGVFTDAMTQTDVEIVNDLYSVSLPASDELIAYMSTGATAEELVLLCAADEEEAKTFESAAAKRVEEQKESYRDYIPAEVATLDSAIIRREGKYVLVCVAHDAAAAEELIGEVLG